MTRGTGVTLNWNVANAPNCTANTTYTYGGDNVISSWGPGSSKAGSGSSSFTPTAVGTFNFGCVYTDSNGVQTSDSASLTVTDCASGYYWNGSSCALSGCANGANNPPACNSCPAGYSWNGSSCVLIVNGSCSSTHYNCNSGTAINAAQGASSYTWTCQGANGGTNASCSEPLPGVPSCSSVGPSAPTAYGTSGTFRVYAYGVQNATSVYFPTWGEVNGQNDIVWYPGANAGGGTWYADVNLGNHVAGAPEYGTFDTHVYLNGTSASNVFCNAMTWQRQTDTPSCTGGGPQSSQTLATSGSFRVYAYGVSANTTSMYFPTWGLPNGQNDLVWYPGTNAGGGTWYADVNLGNHVAGAPEYGTFETDVYMNSASQSNVGCIGYQWTRGYNNAACVSLTAPTSVTAGQVFSATVVMNNNGTSNWTQADQYKLGSQPQDNQIWGLSRILMPTTVTPGNNGTFTFNATAPTTPGTYPFGWAMLQEGVQWFGTTCTQNIVVNGTPAATISGSPNPCTVSAGANTCSSGITWNITNATSPNVYSSYTGGNITTAASGSAVPQTVAIGGTNFTARDGTTNLASAPIYGICANGLAYSGGVCTACSNGGCTGTGGTPSNPNGGLTCSNGSPTPPTCPLTPTASLSGNPTTIVTGQAATLSWSSTNSSSCQAAGGGTWMGSTNTSGSASVSPSSTTSYQITCNGSTGGTANSNIVTITVVPPTATLTATPSRVHAGQSSTIAWSSTNTTSCTISGPGLSASGTSGSRAVTVNSQAVYTLNCTTGGTPISKTVTVNIIPDFQEF